MTHKLNLWTSLGFPFLSGMTVGSDVILVTLFFLNRS
jgi:hypothetical protein